MAKKKRRNDEPGPQSYSVTKQNHLKYKEHAKNNGFKLSEMIELLFLEDIEKSKDPKFAADYRNLRVERTRRLISSRRK